MSSIIELTGQKSIGYKIKLHGCPEKSFVPPGFKPSKGSCLRVNARGIVSYNHPDLYPGDWSPGSRKFKAPVVHPQQTDSKTVYEALSESIEARRIKPKSYARLQSHHGRPVGRGYWMVNTDGHTALITKDKTKVNANENHFTVFDSLWDKWKMVAEISDPEFHLAIKRAAIMAPESGMVQLFGNRDTITVYSKTEGQCDYVGKVPAINGEFWQTAVNVKFLEPLCGVWPLYVNYSEKHAAIVFYPQSADWAYIVMPMRAK